MELDLHSSTANRACADSNQHHQYNRLSRLAGDREHCRDKLPYRCNRKAEPHRDSGTFPQLHVRMHPPPGSNCTFDLRDKAASPPNYNVVVTNPDGKQGMRANYFVLSSPAPTITSSTPSTGAQAATIMITSLFGTNFQPGAKVDYTLGNTIINLTNVNVLSRTQISGTLVIPSNASAGSYGVNITNTDNGKGYRAARFTVTSNAPTISSSTPATGVQGTTVVITRLLGTNFQPGAVVVYSNGTTSMPLTSTTVVSSTNITGTLVIPADAMPGPYNVTVTNADLKSISRAATFTVTSNAPTVTARSNATIYTGWMGYELITGTRFVTGAQSVLNTTTGNSIPSTSCDVRSSTQMFCSYDLLGTPVSTAYRVTVINPDGKSGLMTNNLVSVSSPAPTITSSTPSTGAQAATVVITRLLGTYFQPGATVVYSLGGTYHSLTKYQRGLSNQYHGDAVHPFGCNGWFIQCNCYKCGFKIHIPCCDFYRYQQCPDSDCPV